MIVEGRRDVPDHDQARQSSGESPKPEVALRACQLLLVTNLQSRLEPLGKACRRLNRGKVSEDKKRPANLCVVLRTAFTFSSMPLHADQLDTGERIVYKCKVLITKLATIHGDRLRVRKQVPASGEPVPEPTNLIYVWSNDFRERVSGPVKSRLDRSEIALGDLRDFLVGLALELSQNEHISVVLGELCHTLLNDLSQVTLPVHIIRTGGRIFELKRAILVLEVLLNRLEENERIPRTVPQLILRQIRRDRIDPGRELFRTIEAVQMAIDPDEDFLDQILCLLPVTDSPVNKVQQPGLIPSHEL